MKRFAAVTAAILLVTVCNSLSAGETADKTDPIVWLERMAAAMDQMSYQGTFVYVQDERLETIRVTHVADPSGGSERMVSMSGEQREVIRDPEGVQWVLGKDHTVLKDPAFKRSILRISDAGQYAESYSLELGKTARIAGQTARHLKILPRDRYRYGYSLWLEEHTGVLLKWELVDTRLTALASLMFTDIRFGSEVDVRELQPSESLDNYRTLPSDIPSGEALAPESLTWRPERLPKGFVLKESRTVNTRQQDRFEHLVYGDGLAAVSVYIEPSIPGHEPGLRRLGTTHAFTRITDGMLVTVVGDVPVSTVRLIADSVVLAAH